MLPSEVELLRVGDINLDTDWSSAFEGIEWVVHLAGRAHVLNEATRDPYAEFLKVNAHGTECLARAAAEAGVKRLIYVSSVHVNGTRTSRSAFTEDHEPSPRMHYAISKWEAEKALQRIALATDLETVILRPPLVYGPGVKANFLRLMELVDNGLPLPFRSIKNRRSLLYVGNLADAIACCLGHPDAAGKTFLLSDGEDVSTPQLIRHIGGALGRKPRLLPFPPSAIRSAARLAGRLSMAEPLLDDLVVDTTRIRRVLGWTPPYSMTHGMRDTAEWFRSAHGKDAA